MPPPLNRRGCRSRSSRTSRISSRSNIISSNRSKNRVATESIPEVLAAETTIV